MKIIKASLKENVNVCTNLADIDFEANIFTSSTVIERQKRDLLQKIKQAMHEKIATLDMDDIKFEIVN